MININKNMCKYNSVNKSFCNYKFTSPKSLKYLSGKYNENEKKLDVKIKDNNGVISILFSHWNINPQDHKYHVEAVNFECTSNNWFIKDDK